MNLVTRKLGKNAPKPDDRIKDLSRYLKTAKLPSPLKRVNWVNGVGNLGMMLNDNEGDCTIACFGHMIEVHSLKESKKEIIIPDSAIQKGYVDVTGQEGAAYDPKTGANDNGCAITDVLAYGMKTGIGGQKILGYTRVNSKDHDHVKIGIRLFGGLDIGLALPTSANSQVGQIWDVPSEGLTGDGTPGSWGGHCVPPMAYMDNESLTLITWGALQVATWRFMDAYCDEMYAVITEAWVANNGINPDHFNLSLLQSDMQAIKTAA